MTSVRMQKAVIVTGVSGDIGVAVAREFLNNNFLVIGLSRSNADICEENRKDIKCLNVDLSDYDALPTIESRVKTIYEKIKIAALVHCAGAYLNTNNVGRDEKALTSMLSANLLTAHNATRLGLQCVSPNGSIIIVNSQAAITPKIEELEYGISKRSVSAMCDGLQFEATKRGLQLVNLLSGAVNSKMANNRPGAEKFISASDLAKCIYGLSMAGPTLRIKDIEVLRRVY